jgi:hypothetical protein
MFENMDLDINNYSLDDLLKLFKLSYNFTEEELKKTKKVVLNTHPDKSGLDKKIFIFFTSAYKLVYSIYLFNNNNKNKNLTREDYEHNDHIKQTLIKFSKQKNFNNKFNELFEKYNLNSEEINNGYGEWLKNDEIDNYKAKNVNEMTNIINKKKNELRSMIVKEELIDIGNGINIQQTLLTGEKPKYYDTDVFGHLKYDDLKRAYNESVIPVTEEDYKNKPKYNSVDDYNRFRKTDILNEYKNSNHNDKFNEYKKQQEISNTNRAYILAKQQEITKIQNDKFIHSLYKLKN